MADAIAEAPTQQTPPAERPPQEKGESTDVYAARVLNFRLSEDQVSNNRQDGNNNDGASDNEPTVGNPKIPAVEKPQIRMPESPQVIESPEAAQKRIDGIHLREARTVALKILDHNSHHTEQNLILGESTKENLKKYKNILDIKTIPLEDCTTPYIGLDKKILEYVPLNSDGDGPYLRMENGKFFPSDYAIPGSIEIVQITEKHGQTVTCIDKDGNTHTGVPIDILADAQMHTILKVNRDKGKKSFTGDEVKVLEAWDTFTQTKSDEEIQNLYKGDATDIKEAAKKYGNVSIDSVNTFLEKTYPEYENPQSAEEMAHNIKMQERKAAIRSKLALDARVIADGEVLVGLTSETTADTLDNLQKAITASTNPQERQQLQDAYDYLKGHQGRIPKIENMDSVMQSALTPEIAEDLNKSLSNGDLGDVYKKLLEQFPDSEDKIDNLKSQFGEQALKIGGIGIIAIIAALAFGVSSQMGRQR